MSLRARIHELDRIRSDIGAALRIEQGRKICPIKTQEEAMTVDRLRCTVAALLAMACLSLPAAAQVAKAVLKDASGKAVGDVNLIQTSNGVLIRLTVKGLPAGEHAFHVHAVGKCEPPFTTAGDHLNPGSKKHGLEAADGAHAGICRTCTYHPAEI
jgi:Cu/Zn superoxide dismutase